METGGTGTGLTSRVARVAHALLAPGAAEVDRSTVARSTLDALAPTGVFGMAVDPAVTAPEAREATELLAAADAATWFVTAQHHLVARYAAEARTPVRERWAGDLASGRLIGGQGFSQLRRPGPPTLRATRVEGGWRFDGTVPWYTGWGLNDLCLLAGRTGTDDRATGGSGGEQAVFAVVPATAGPHLWASDPLSLLAMSATRTVALTVDGLVVGDDDLARVVPLHRWAAADGRRTPNVNPAVFGVARASLAGLAAAGGTRVPGLSAAVAAFGARLDDVRSSAYRLLDEVPDDEALTDRLELRVTAVRLALDVTAAEVAAGAGAAMDLRHPAQRHAREALFLSVQAQTPDVRAATIASLAG